MNIDYYKQFEPIDGKWYITREIGSGAFGYVVEVERHDYSEMKSAMKIISVPATEDELKDFRRENFLMSDSQVKQYYKSIVTDYIREFQLLSKLKGNSNIVSYEDHDVREKKDSIGWDIFIRMELLTPMTEYFKERYTREQVIKLGIDICKALEVCGKHDIIHRDIKPTNIFVSDNGDFKLGDFGVARVREKSSGNMSAKGTYTYMAPEVCHGKPYTVSADLYSLGIVMYRLLNNNFEPFRTEAGYKNAQNALEMRLKGTPIGAPINADARLSEIILKALAFEPEYRYESPVEFRQRLEALVAGTYRTEAFTVSDNNASARISLSKNNIENDDVKIAGDSKDKNRKNNKTQTNDVNEKKSIFKTVIAAIVSGILCVGIVCAVGTLKFNGMYNEAQKYFRAHKFVEAKEQFEEIAWYKDSGEMIFKCDYRRADMLLEKGEYEKAYEIFETLKKYGYLDSDEKCDACLLENAKWYADNSETETALELLNRVSAKNKEKADEIAADLRYDYAISLYEKKHYSDAKKIFAELNDDNMVDECDYKMAINHMMDGNYARAMSLLAGIMDYSDSSEQFVAAEKMLSNENKTSENFSMYKNLVGRYSNEDGVYVEYKSDSQGNTETAYNLAHDESELFKIVDGIHYHLISEGNWKKQWIFDKVSSKEFDVYNYLDFKVYTLILE